MDGLFIELTLPNHHLGSSRELLKALSETGSNAVGFLPDMQAMLYYQEDETMNLVYGAEAIAALAEVVTRPVHKLPISQQAFDELSTLPNAGTVGHLMTYTSARLEPGARISQQTMYEVIWALSRHGLTLRVPHLKPIEVINPWAPEHHPCEPGQ